MLGSVSVIREISFKLICGFLRALKKLFECIVNPWEVCFKCFKNGWWKWYPAWYDVIVHGKVPATGWFAFRRYDVKNPLCIMCPWTSLTQNLIWVTFLDDFYTGPWLDQWNSIGCLHTQPRSLTLNARYHGV